MVEYDVIRETLVI